MRGLVVGIVGLGMVALSAIGVRSADAGPAASTGSAGTGVGQSPCGVAGKPPCPLQAWMRANVAAPLASNDGAALAAGLEKAAKLVPDPTWASWVAIASDGAAAAKKGDLAGARASCKACHDAWREPYKAKFRMAPLPQ